MPYFEELENNGEIEICAIVDNKPHNQEELDGYKIIYAKDLKNYKYDKILIAADLAYDSIVADLKQMSFEVSTYERAIDYIKSKVLLLDCFYDNSIYKQLNFIRKFWGY